MKSNHLLMTISLLYHTWEQQLIKFTIGEMSHYLDFTRKVMQYNEAQKVFELHGIKISDTAAWRKIKELKLLTNTIKHGDGDSAERLRKIRPDYFKSDYLDDSTDLLELNGAVLLDGLTIKANESDLEDYVKATMGFWDEMPERAFSDTEKIMNEFQ